MKRKTEKNYACEKILSIKLIATQISNIQLEKVCLTTCTKQKMGTKKGLRLGNISKTKILAAWVRGSGTPDA